MSAGRWIKEDALLRVIRNALPTGTHGREMVVAAVKSWLSKQPTAPDQVGATEAARILGIQPPHISRLKEQGRMPEPIKVKGSVDVYHLEEVEALAKVLEAERKERARKRTEREANHVGSGG